MPFVHAIDPVLFQLGPVPVRWYGLMYAAAFLFMYFWLRHDIRTGRFRLKEHDLDSLMIAATTGILVGARLFWLAVYSPDGYLANPLRAFAIWEGGLSSHGALAGGMLGGWLVLRRKKIRFLHAADAVFVPASIAGFFGRLGNFFNGEMPGKLTSLPWGMQFPGIEGFRHPAPLYDAAYNLLIFFILLAIRRKHLPEGRIFAWSLVLYSILRFLAEFLKEPVALIGPFAVAQVWSLPILAAGAWLLYSTRIRKNSGTPA